MLDRFLINILGRTSLGVWGAAALCLAGCRKEPVTTAQDSRSVGRAVVFDSMSKRVNPDTLDSMRWQDIAPTAESCFRHGLTEKALKVSRPLTSPPTIYLRGLLKFTTGDIGGAAEEWDKLDVSVIPADHLYAPWRVAAANTGGENRYESPLTEAVATGRASPLIRARFHCIHNKWRDALDAYLLSDPSNWSTFEIKSFATLKLQAPCTRDVEILMAGALSGGHVLTNLRVDLARLIKGTPIPDRDALGAKLRSDPALSEAATAGAARALSLRQAFASDQFQKVLAQVQSADPLESADEAVLLAFLSTARLKDLSECERWAAELLRRNPNENTRKWIASIRAEAH